ncbi:hypothetical protein Aph01nite_39480 [Acrocarpospora phusangensis]|uniref:Uncharacterized protein n=1 Tax=Acrocarpospora phusangensis TaxID=1070424 RepID=A0A919UPR5_9ACTN|nr:hypothetical protein [Acrocarpospora phusangensis]GIH25638.1 hypothetical protein Aph01nite_39480 [Acrocarpospora phusangensis]
MPDIDTRLLASARLLRPVDPGLRDCWNHVVRAIELGWLGPAEVHEVVVRLRAGHDIGFQDLSFDRLGNRVRVSLHGQEGWCAPEDLRGLLVGLVAGRSRPDFASAPIAWAHTGDGEFPYRADVGGDALTLRVNDFPAEPLYTLIVNGHEHLDLDDWPRSWVRPPMPRQLLELAEARVRRRAEVPLDAGLLQAWAQALCRLSTDDPALVARSLGLLGELVPRRGEFAVEPPPPGVAELLISSRAGRFKYVKVQPSSTALIRADLDALLGIGFVPPRVHWDSPHTRVYRVAVADAPYSCDVTAEFYFSEEPKATATVLEVSLHRMPAHPAS